MWHNAVLHAQGKPWLGVPVECMELIRGMLVVNPSDRTTMVKTIENTWVKEKAGI